MSKTKLKINGAAVARSVESLSGMTLFQMYVAVKGGVKPEPQVKDDLLKAVNDECLTKYQRRHLDNWIAGRASMPRAAAEYMRREVLTAVIGVEAVQMLSGMFET